MSSLKKPRAASKDAKDERSVRISFAMENPDQSARSKFHQKELEGIGEG